MPPKGGALSQVLRAKSKHRHCSPISDQDKKCVNFICEPEPFNFENQYPSFCNLFHQSSCGGIGKGAMLVRWTPGFDSCWRQKQFFSPFAKSKSRLHSIQCSPTGMNMKKCSSQLSTLVGSLEVNNDSLSKKKLQMKISPPPIAAAGL